MELATAAVLKGWRWPEEAERRARELPFVFNLGSPGAKRRLLRIYERCLIPGALEGLSVAGIYADLIPGAGRTVTGASLQVYWSVSDALICKLVRLGELEATFLARRGSKSSPRISRASAISFLKRRRVREPALLPIYSPAEPAGLWTFNLASPGARRPRLCAYRRCFLPGGLDGMTDARIYREMVAGRGGAITARTLRTVWGVSDYLINRLVSSGALRGTIPPGRAAGQAVIARADAIRFLKARRLKADQAKAPRT